MSTAAQRKGKRSLKGKFYHGRILPAGVELLPIDDVFPSPENDKLYRPPDCGDPDLRALADSIRKHGIREPIVITLDGFILSGHRRYAAARLAGEKFVPCRREPIVSTDENFVLLLREYNRQRVKSIDEVLREEIVSINPDDAYEALIQHRREAARVNIETQVIEGRKHRARITEAKRPFLDAILAILERLRSFWPLSDRQIHYQLLNAPPLIHASKPDSTYRNHPNSYGKLTELLTRARITGVIPFEAIHDPTRPVTTWDAFRSPAPFIRRELDNFLKGFWRDLMAPQPIHCEILGEKNTIASIIKPVASRYGIPFTLGRGYASLPPRHEMKERFRKTGKDKLVLIALADHDPEGEDIAHSFARSMRDDFGIRNIEYKKAALTAQQVEELGLPPGELAKEKSSRRKKFVERHGEHVFELEAIEPTHLQRILSEAIESIIDMKLFRQEEDQEKRDAAYLHGVRQKVQQLLAGIDK